MKKDVKDLVVKALRKVVDQRNETANCGICGRDDDGNNDDHNPSCPYPDAVAAMDALGISIEVE